MKDPIKNIAASVLSQLRNQTEMLGRPFAEVLQYYAMERFLYRLSKTRYADKFILKGGLLFYVWNLPLRRPTRDIDFRGYVSNNSKSLLNIINEVITEPAPEDGIVFDPQSVSVEETQIDADYQGIRVKLTALLERSRIPIQIDIGFSDDLTSKVDSIEYPNILPDLKTVQMKGYPKEAVVAEKFHAMVRHAELNSRMKDYYDIWLISETFELESKSLEKAIESTFKKRDTEIPSERPLSLSAEFARASQIRWTNFLNKMDLENEQVADLQSVIEKIWIFLERPIEASLNKTKTNHNWIPRKGWK
jgi:predicted nucleotidyltransferase component of viral defense system